MRLFLPGRGHAAMSAIDPSAILTAPNRNVVEVAFNPYQSTRLNR
jgi:hypothetical protein